MLGLDAALSAAEAIHCEAKVMQRRPTQRGGEKIKTVIALAFFGVTSALVNATRPALGWADLLMAAAIAFTSAHKWMKALPGIFGVGTLNCVFALTNGYFGTNPSQRLSRATAGEIAVLMAGSAGLSFGLKGRTVTYFERSALLASIVSIAIAISESRFGIVGLSLALLSLGVAVGKQFRERQKGSGNHSSS